MRRTSKYSMNNMFDILEIDLRSWAKQNRDEFRWERALREVEEIINNLMGEDYSEEIHDILYHKAHDIWTRIQEEFEAEEDDIDEEELPFATRKDYHMWDQNRREKEERDRVLNTPPECRSPPQRLGASGKHF